jgi:uncharacterized protein (TIGR01777 family)
MNIMAKLFVESQHHRRINKMRKDRILLTGSSGLIGTSLVRNLSQNRISTITLHRRLSQPSHDALLADSPDATKLWDPYAAVPLSHPEALEGISAAVHLSGANLAGKRWTSSYKQEILRSRVTTTHALATVLAGMQQKPEVMVCSSAIGIYGGRGDEVLTENSLPGSGFLPELCLAWEKAAQPAIDAGIRVVYLRFGVVLSTQGGALAQMLPVFRAGLGGQLAGGRQWISWIALPDVTRVIEFALNEASLSGAVNVVAPNPVTNAEFTRALGRVLRRPAVLRVPALALRLAFGEMADATILESVRVLPARLQAAGFEFDYPELEAGLRATLPASKE